MFRLILFDIDGTLLLCGRQVRPIFATAMEEVFGTSGALESYDFGGKLDSQIVLEVLGAAGIDLGRIERRLPDFRQLYVERLEARLDARLIRLLPGVPGVVDRLAEDDTLTLGLLTGNWERSARCKLRPFGLNRHFAFGAFGDDGWLRPDLLPVAVERASRYAGRPFSPEEVLLVGDSVHDVRCGQAHGVPVLAVATGFTPATNLAAAGADWVVKDLEEAAGTVLAV